MRAVFFDLDGTLLRNPEHFPSVFARVLAAEGADRPVADVEAALRHRWSWYEQHVGEHRGDELAFWLTFNTEVCRAVGLGPRAEALGRAITEAFRRLDAPVLYDDALPCLEALGRAGLLLGVITARPNAARVLAPLGIASRFCWLVDAFGAGSAKQDPRAFEHALALSGLPGADALHVGDQVERDVMPARAAGMHALLLDRNDRYPDADGPRLRSLAELPEWLEEHGCLPR